MLLVTRTLVFFTLILAFQNPAAAVEVSFVLVSATSQQCHGAQVPCDPQLLPVALTPATPQGGGTLDLDVVGALLHGALHLEAFTIDGVELPAWSDTIRQGSGGLLSVGTRWPLHPYSRVPEVTMTLDSFVDQSTFTGAMDLVVEDDWNTVWRLHFEFASREGSEPPACVGVVLLVDDDADGEATSRDEEPFARGSTGPVDDNGLFHDQFCAAHVATCERADFLNEEAGKKKPRDCARSAAACVPIGIQSPPSWLRQPPVCAGAPLFADADQDGEPNHTDRCPDTLSGDAIDAAGCSAPQFCALASPSSCERADFENDEPDAKRSGDCFVPKTKPRTCRAAA